VIDLPNLFKKGPEVSGIQWFDAVDSSVHDDYWVTVDCNAEDGVSASENLKKAYQSRKQQPQSDRIIVTYEVLKPKFFILSGTEKDVNDNLIWYSKGIIREGRNYELFIRYMPKYKALFDSILPKIAASFH